MAERITRELIDDLDGSPGAVETPFSVDEYAYVVDLTEDHRRDLYDALEPYMAAGRRVSGPVATRSKRPVMSAELTELIRDWAREHGHRVADRGRLPQAVIDAYQEHIASHA